MSFGFDSFGGGSSGFGDSSGFGSSFGDTTTSSFGAPAPASDPFGFGAPAPAPAAGGWGAPAATDTFGLSQSSGFGSTNYNTFGSAPSADPFGSAAPSSDPFGTGSGFGAPAPASDPFGFGAPAASSSNNSSNSDWGFGAPAPAPASGGDPFGSSTSFGGSSGLSAEQLNPENPNDRRLKKDPGDGVTQLSFHPTMTKFLLASTWGCKALLYDCTRSENYCAVFPHKAPVLCCGFQSASVCVTGDCAGLLRMWDLKTKQPKVFGKHKQPIRCLKWQKEKNVCMTGSWDNTVAFWDPRQSTGKPSMACDLGGPVHCFDSVDSRVVASAKSDKVEGGSIIKSFDWRNPKQIANEHARDWIKFQHRTIACFKQPRAGYAVGTIGGKVGIRYFNPNKKQKNVQNFVFRCHQKPAGKTFAVNDIKFNKHGTFATCGADGTYNVWDKGARTVSVKSGTCKDAIACCAWDTDANAGTNFFAYSVSYEWSQGPRQQKNANCIYYRQLQQKDVRMRTRRTR